ncbi:substrate-binding periplasmic protein [Rugamonas apoptosis]|uniref:Transporter substrate-binding domain-containing protein n=1 Tax=Rugamonas apoptosis TaxID=2758570 RepID=A0A7W2ILW7_9BURK|nr:transporter substrate-binding domain-containing protein [Rugamonas apoptosis]MBA5689073.1 transporter substrate-binding domain-containing protein [Rugamonas apoptosis]
MSMTSIAHTTIALLLGWAGVGAAVNTHATPLAPEQVIRVCGQVAEWPPYLYFRRDQGGPTDDVIGYSAEMLQLSLERKGLRYTLDMLPWRRCTESVRLGMHDMMTDLANDPYRAKTYLVSKPYYTQHLVYFFDMSRPRPAIDTAADLKKLRLCAVNGYTYAAFGLNPAQIDTGSQDLMQSLLKLKNNRCDAVPERLEIALGYQALGKIDFKVLGISYGALPDLQPSPFHMMVSRNVPYAAELLEVLDDGIESLGRGGDARRLAAKYGITDPGLGRPPRRASTPVR